MSDETNHPSNEQPGQVLTPGGPRAPELVRHVAPGESVRMTEAGEPAVVPDGHGRRRCANTPRAGPLTCSVGPFAPPMFPRSRASS
jgi:hypothetical protein